MCKLVVNIQTSSVLVENASAVLSTLALSCVSDKTELKQMEKSVSRRLQRSNVQRVASCMAGAKLFSLLLGDRSRV